MGEECEGDCRGAGLETEVRDFRELVDDRIPCCRLFHLYARQWQRLAPWPSHRRLLDILLSPRRDDTMQGEDYAVRQQEKEWVGDFGPHEDMFCHRVARVAQCDLPSHFDCEVSGQNRGACCEGGSEGLRQRTISGKHVTTWETETCGDEKVFRTLISCQWVPRIRPNASCRVWPNGGAHRPAGDKTSNPVANTRLLG